MGNAAQKLVISKLADLVSRSNYFIDKLNPLREPRNKGDTIAIPNIGALTVYNDGGVAQDAQAVDNQELVCTVDKHPWIPALLPMVSQTQLMGDGGDWASDVALQGLATLKNKIDTEVIDYLLGVAWDSLATPAYHDNVAGDALTVTDVLECIAALQSNGGVGNLAWFLNPFGQGSVLNLNSGASKAFVENYAQDSLGLNRLGYLFGIPCYTSQSVRRGRTIVASASTGQTTNVRVTVGANHGVVVGMKAHYVSSSTATNDIAAAANVVAVGATTIDIAKGSAGTATVTEAGTVYVDSTENLLVDLAGVYASQQKMPGVEIVKDTRTTGSIAQISGLYGRVARAGRVRVLHTPLTVG